jgi:dihydroneopterin triphosphate diphosphatase
MIELHIFRETEKGIEFLLLKRSEKEIYPGLWQMVSGKIEEGETAFSAAIREMKEETGMKPLQFWAAPNVNHFYSPENDSITLLPVFAAKVDKDSSVIICDEHCDCRWVDPEEAKRLLAWPGQRKSVDLITEYISLHQSFLKFIEVTPDKFK